MKMTKVQTLCVVLVCMSIPALTGCLQPNWEKVSPLVQEFTFQGAQLAFSNPQVAAQKEKICIAVNAIAGVLENYGDQDATFDKLKQLTLDALEMLELEEPLKSMVVNVVDKLLTETIRFIYAYFGDQINSSNEAQWVLQVSRDVAMGLKNACETLQIDAQTRPKNSFLYPEGYPAAK